METFYSPPIVAIDFDETIYGNGYPDLSEGHFIKDAIWGVKKIQKAGWRTILWTCRCGKYLEHAKEILEEEGIVFDAYNNNALTNEEFEEFNFKDSRKVGADFYIDDKDIRGRPDWRDVVEKLLSLYNTNSNQKKLFRGDLN